MKAVLCVTAVAAAASAIPPVSAQARRAAASAALDWSSVDKVLQDAISQRVSPGLAGGVLDSTGQVVYQKAFGNYVYAGDAPPPDNAGSNPLISPRSTLFDMASVTKIIGATTASALLYQQGLLDLDMLVSDPSLLGPAFASSGKGSIRVRDCLLHQAGYPPDPSPGYSDPAFGCPATSLPQPPLTFNCSERIFNSLLAQTLQYPTGSQWLYSDLSMITMQFVLGTVAFNHNLVTRDQLLPGDCQQKADPGLTPGLLKTCYFEAFVRTHVIEPFAMANSQFLPPTTSYSKATPTWNDTYYRNTGILQGVVCDENAYALGGIAGHAGVFSTLSDMLAFVGSWAGYGQPAGFSTLIQEATRTLFFTNPRPTFGPRALGWVTQAATDTYQGCGSLFSSETAYHTGYSGTLLCIDPKTNISLVLLTNRVYPNKTAEMPQIQAVRQAFGEAVVRVLQGTQGEEEKGDADQQPW